MIVYWTVCGPKQSILEVFMNTIKKYAAFFAVICLLLCAVFALGSCGEEEYAYNYKVTLTDTDGAAVKDAEIILVGANSITEAKKTGEDGTVVWGMDTADTFAVKVLSIPEGYALLTTDYKFAEGSTELAINQVSKLLEYTVTVKDTSGAVVVGAAVTLNVDGENTVTKATDANGIASFNVGKAADVKANVVAPEGYVLAESEYTFTEKALNVSGVVKLDTYKVYLYDQNAVPVVGASLKLAIDAENGAQTAAVLTDAEGAAVFAVVPGSYKLVIDTLPSGYSVALDDATFAAGSFEKNVAVTALANYKVNVVDQYGNAVNGASVKLTVDNNVYDAKLSDANGLVAFGVAPGTKLVAELVSAPAGYTLKLDNAPVEYAKNATEATVTMYKNVAYAIRVVDDGGNLIVGATVKGYAGDVEIGTATTDEEGVAQFFVSPENTVTVDVIDAGDDYTIPAGLTDILLNAETIETAQIIANYKYSVTIYDQYGAAVEGITVAFVVDVTDYGTLTTDAEGKVVFNVAPGTTAVATITEVVAGYSKSSIFEVTFGDSLDVSMDIIKHKDYTVTVFDGDGETPIEGAIVKLIVDDAEYIAEVGTDADGKVSFNVIPASSAVYAEVVELPAGYTAPERVKFVAGVNEADVVVINNVDYTVTLLDQYGAVVPGASVVLKIDGVEHAAIITDAEGKAVLNVAPGTVVLAYITAGEGYLYIGEDGVAFEAEALALSAVVHKLTYYTVTLKTVTGQAVPGATVTITLGGIEYDGISDADGVVSIGIVPVDGATVTATVEVPTGYELDDVDYEFAAGATELTVDSVIKCIDYTITVVDKDGVAVAGVTVTLYKKDGTFVAEYVSDAEGKIILPLITDLEYYFTVSQPNTALTWTTVDAGDNKHSFTAGPETSYNVVLTDSGEKIAYTITLTDANGNPLSDKTVNFYDVNFKVVATAVTGANGVATAELVNGTYYAIFDIAISKTTRPNYIPAVEFTKNGAVSAAVAESTEKVGSGAETAMIVTPAGFAKTSWSKSIFGSDDKIFFRFVGCEGATVKITLNSEVLALEYNGAQIDPVSKVITFTADSDDAVANFVLKGTAPALLTVTVEITK